MEKIELTTPNPEKVLPILQDAIDREKRILLQSLIKTEENIQQLAARLGVDTDLLLSGKVPHPEKEDMDLLELEGELEISRHLREQIESLEHLAICR